MKITFCPPSIKACLVRFLKQLRSASQTGPTGSEMGPITTTIKEGNAGLKLPTGQSDSSLCQTDQIQLESLLSRLSAPKAFMK